ncbi:MAG: SGNH/GDSL hydrolase family protein [Promethearchaeota archaeon]
MDSNVIRLIGIDIERAIVLLFFAFVVFILLKIFGTIYKKRKYRWFAAPFLLLFLLLSFSEIVTRSFFYLKYDELGMLIYPLRAYTENNLRLIWTPPHKLEKNGLVETSGDSYVRFMTGLNYVKAFQNSNRFRFKPPISKQDGINIYCLGGSSTWGPVSDGKTYPDILQVLLNNEKHIVNVWNLGKPAHSSPLFIQNLQQSGLLSEQKPDIIILYIGHNDSHEILLMHESYSKTKREVFLSVNKYPIVKYSFLARAIWLVSLQEKLKDIEKSVLSKKWNHEEIEKEKGIPTHLALQENLQNKLVELINFSKEINPDIKFVLVPEYSQYVMPITEFKKSYDFLELKSIIDKQERIEAYKIINFAFWAKEKIMQDIAAKNSNVFYLGNEFFDVYAPSSLLSDEVHLTEFGDDVLARNIVQFLNMKGIIGSPSKGSIILK